MKNTELDTSIVTIFIAWDDIVVPDVVTPSIALGTVAVVLMVTPVAVTVFNSGTVAEAVVKALLTMVFMFAGVFALICVATEACDTEAGTLMV